jgi:hypothetical protein
VCGSVRSHDGGGAVHRGTVARGRPRLVASKGGVNVDFFSCEHKGAGFLRCGGRFGEEDMAAGDGWTG